MFHIFLHLATNNHSDALLSSLNRNSVDVETDDITKSLQPEFKFHVEIKVWTEPELIKQSYTWRLLREKERPKNQKLESLKQIYRKPIRFVKLKIDNTWEYKLGPNVLLQFFKDVLKNAEYRDKLIALQAQHDTVINENGLKSYNITDYLDTIDEIVQRAESNIYPYSKATMFMLPNVS